MTSRVAWWISLTGWTIAATGLIAAPAFGLPTILEEWQNTYPESSIPDDLIEATGAPCQLCHVNTWGAEPWNQYGYAVLSAGGLANIPDAFFEVEPDDSDGEGTVNLDEIRANTTPGWCESERPGCENLAWTRDGISSPATPPEGVVLDPPPGGIPPTADPGGPYAGIAGQPLSFDGSGSFDPDGSIVGWQWSFGDGGQAFEPAPVHVYEAEGDYEVSLTVTDSNGLTDTGGTTATILPDQELQPPVADPGGPYAGAELEPITFDGSGSIDLDGKVVGWLWDFGDGNFGSGEIVSHSYAAQGLYTVTIAVIDNDGLTDTETTSADISRALTPGETIYKDICVACHGNPFRGPPVDPELVAGRRNTGARTCSIEGAIFGNAVFPGGVPEMQFLQDVLSDADIQAVSGFLNSRLPVQARRRYVTTCAGCHGNDASGGRVGRDIRGERPEDVWQALHEEPEMQYLQCIPNTDIRQIGRYLETLDDG